MTTEAKPALAPKRWQELAGLTRAEKHDMMVQYLMRWYASKDEESLAAALAMVNASLPDGDPRKITPAMVDSIRDAARSMERAQSPAAAALRAHADALASLIPVP